ncbi:MAG: hypothetical protein ACRCVV_21985 [Shewanella sp.]
MRATNPLGKALAVDKYINTAYDKVVIVSDNIDKVISLSDLFTSGGFDGIIDNLDGIIDNLDEIIVVANSITDVIAVAASIDAVESVSSILSSVVRVSASADNVDIVANDIDAIKAVPTYMTEIRQAVTTTTTNEQTSTTNAASALASKNAASASEIAAKAAETNAAQSATQASQSATEAAQSAASAEDAKNLANQVLDNYMLKALYRFSDIASASTLTINPNTATVQRITLNVPTTNVSVALNANADEAMTVTLIIKQGTGANSINWAGVTWPNGVKPALSHTAGDEDVVAMLFTKGTNKCYGFYLGSGL